MKRISIFAGHYGSGKTNLSVNYALKLKEKYDSVLVCDVDTVNPYFRTKDSEETLKSLGITLIAPEYANSNLDMPSISVGVNRAFDDKEAYSVFDVGGDDAGAIALGQFKEKIINDNYDMFLVINKNRFLTRNAVEVLSYKEEIEAVSQIKFTAIINNTNVGAETTGQHILDSISYAKEVSELTNLPVAYTSMTEEIFEKLKDKVENPLKIQIFKKSTWSI